jgi:hypothetical protein
MNTSVSKSRENQQLSDWASGMGNLPPANQRVQVKMPAMVVKKLDELYPNVDRSQIITQLALQAIVQQLRFIDRPDIGGLADAEQSTLNDMWDYLKERDEKI